MDKRKVIKIYRKGKKNSIYYTMKCRYCGICFDIMKWEYDRGRGSYHTNQCCNKDKVGIKRLKQSVFMKENNPMNDVNIRKEHKLVINTKDCKEKKIKGMYDYYKNHPESKINRGNKTKQRLKEYPETHPMKQPGAKEKHSKIMKQFYKQNPELSKKQGKSLQKFYEEYPEKHPNRILAKKGHKTKIEKMMQEFLIKLNLIENIDFEYNYRIKRFFVDFALLKRKIVIECDGDYWHGNKEVQKKDAKRQKEIEYKGWKFLRFWEHEILKQPEICLDKIKQII